VVGEAARKHDQSIKVAVAIMQGKYQMPSRTCEETGVYSREHDVSIVEVISILVIVFVNHRRWNDGTMERWNDEYAPEK